MMSLYKKSSIRVLIQILQSLFVLYVYFHSITQTWPRVNLYGNCLYPQFFYIEKKSNRIKILIQNAWRNKTPKKNKNKKYFVDYFLGFNPTISKRYENALHAKIFNIGSLVREEINFSCSSSVVILNNSFVLKFFFSISNIVSVK